jgi:hypothetical protein
MSSPVEFSFRLIGTGWAEGRIAVGDSSATPTASYLSDALGDLIRTVCALLEGAEDARMSWEEEPGEYRWIFERSGSEVRTRLLALDDVYDDAPDEDGEILLDATCALSDLGLGVASGAQHLLNELGQEEYHARWVEHRFPTDDLAVLTQLVGLGRT